MNLARILKNTADKNPGAPALYFGHETITYSDLLKQVNRLANALVDLGLKEGDRIAILMRNVPEFIVSYHAVLSVGCVVVPLCYMCLADEVEKIVCDSATDTLITNFEFDDVVKKLRSSKCAQLTRIIVSDCPELEDVYNYQKLAGSQPDTFEMVEREGDDVAVLLYAPTGAEVVRGCMLTHSNLLSNIEMVAEHLALSEKDVCMGVLPFFAAFGQTCVMNASIRAGSKLILQESFIPGEVLKSIQQENISVFCGVPTMYVYILNHPLIYQYDVSSVRLWVSGGAPLNKDVIERWNNDLGYHIYEGYGLSEAGPAVTLQPLEGVFKAGSSGTPFSDIELKIMGDEGQVLDSGEVGEVLIKGPNVMKGYFEKAEETSTVLKDGWLSTGDMGYLDEDGYLFIVGRKKDLIIRGGFNIYPREIEEVLNSNQLITESAVVGVPNKYLGEEVQAYVKLKPGSQLTEEQILEFCEEKLPYYKTPKFIKFVHSFKKDPSGKIAKYLIEE